MSLANIEIIIIGIVLLIQSYWDVRFKEIPVSVTMVTAIAGLVLSILGKRSWTEIAIALVPGLVCLFLGKITHEAIGYGDGLLLCAMGMYFSYETILAICMTAFILTGIAALGWFVFFHGRAKDQMPFVPFLLVACVTNYLVEMGELL